MLEVDSLSFSFDNNCLFKSLSFKAKSGGALQVVAANGQGKTTLLRTLVDLNRADAGSIKWNGETISNNSDLLANSFYLSHKPGLKLYLTVRENLQLFKILYKLKNLDYNKLLDELKLLKQQDLLAGQLSQGQAKRLALAPLFMRDFELIILDEAFSGLDKSFNLTLANELNKKLAANALIIFSSHLDNDLNFKPSMTINLHDYQ